MDDTSNRREFTRASTTIGVQIRFEGDRLVQGRMRNVSLKGVGVDGVDIVPIGSDCHVEILLDGPEGSESVRARGRVVRAGDEGLGIEFAEIEGLDSLDHLRRLVLYNAPAADSVEAEFASHVGLNPRGPNGPELTKE